MPTDFLITSFFHPVHQGGVAPVVAMHSRRHPPLTWSTLNRDCHCQCNLSTFYIYYIFYFCSIFFHLTRHLTSVHLCNPVCVTLLLIKFVTVKKTTKKTQQQQKRIAHLQASRSKEPYSVLTALLRCRLCFALLHASVMCLRGARRAWHAPEEKCASLAVVEARVAV